MKGESVDAFVIDLICQFDAARHPPTLGGPVDRKGPLSILDFISDMSAFGYIRAIANGLASALSGNRNLRWSCPLYGK